MIAEPRIVEFGWNPKQSRFILSKSKYLSLSGGVRAGKTWALCYKVWQWTQQFPGIRIVLSRWSDDNLQAQLVPEWRGMCRKVGASAEWNAKEEAEEFSNGSIVYLRSLKSSDDSQRFSKLAGLTISVLAIDQAEEAEADVIRHYVPARLSQPGFPHAFWITPNPSLPTHWTSEWWPEDNSRAGYEYIHTTPYDNRINLGEEYIRDLEEAYEPGSLEHRRLILGKRGLMVAGDPIYGPHFIEALHVGADGGPLVDWDPRLPLYEAWDFGTLRPAVVYGQFPIGGRMHVLGGIRGQRLPLDQFVPLVLETREKWFPKVVSSMVQTTCDPAGQAPNSHGSRTAVETLRSYGIYPVVHENANDPRIRAGCIEEIVGYLRRRAHHGTPLFKLNPRFVLFSNKGPKHEPMLQDVFSGGYVYDPRKTYHGTAYQGITPPLKDKLYEDLANAVEYLVYAFAPPDAAFRAGLVQNPIDAKRAQRTMQAHAEAVSRSEDQAEIMARLEAVSRLPLRPEERARFAGRLTQARSALEASRIARRALALAQRDNDPADRVGRSGLSRGGYVRVGR